MTIASSQTAPPAGATPPHNGFSLVSNEKLLQLYSTMLKCRLLEERIRLLAKQGHSAATYPALKQEAAVAGIGVDLLPADTLAPGPRGFVPGFIKGLPLGCIFSALSIGSAGTRSPYASLKLIAPSMSLAAQLNRAMIAAAANKKSRNKKIAVAFCGNPGESSDLLLKAMCQTGKQKLPMLLVCHSSSDTDEICRQAQEYGIPGVVVDGDDAVAVYRVATEAIAHARRGSGPTLIECRPWPVADSESGRRRTADPIVNMETYLTRKGLFEKKFKSSVTASFRRELDHASKAVLEQLIPGLKAR